MVCTQLRGIEILRNFIRIAMQIYSTVCGLFWNRRSFQRCAFFEKKNETDVWWRVKINLSCNIPQHTIANLTSHYKLAANIISRDLFLSWVFAWAPKQSIVYRFSLSHKYTCLCTKSNDRSCHSLVYISYLIFSCPKLLNINIYVFLMEIVKRRYKTDRDENFRTIQLNYSGV